MLYKEEYRVDEVGSLTFFQGFSIIDSDMRLAYTTSLLVECLIEGAVTMGVMVGRA